jgi:hypothetical protein
MLREAADINKQIARRAAARRHNPPILQSSDRRQRPVYWDMN